jgi:MoaA/NifB/PqqE/SkfB family radical SAM enzyme
MGRLRELGFRIRHVEEQLRGLYAYDPVRRRSALPGPFAVQLQTVNRCNASCAMCPYSAADKSGPPDRMDGRLYQRILEALCSPGKLRLLAPMLQNEPLLDSELEEKVRQAKATLGRKVHVGIVTNGSALTSRRIDDLVRAGVDSIEVSVDAYQQETFEAIRPGLRFSKVVENTRELLGRAGDLRVVVRFLRQQKNQGEELAFKRYWESQKAMVRFFTLANRAGTLEEYGELKSSAEGRLQRYKRSAWEGLVRAAARSRYPTPCLLPFTWLNVLWDGRVILCCHDWGPKDVIGDLSTQTLDEVWNGEAINHYRHLLWSGRIPESRVCKDCSIVRRSTPEPEPGT